MDISKSVQVLVLVKHLVSVLLVITIVVIHDDDFTLAVFIDLLELGVFTSLIFDSLDKLTLHGRMARQVAHSAIEFIVVFAIFFKLTIAAIFIRAHAERFATLGGRLTKRATAALALAMR